MRDVLLFLQMVESMVVLNFSRCSWKLVGAEAVKYYRRNNQRYIKKHWFDINLEGEVVFKNEIKKNE